MILVDVDDVAASRPGRPLFDDLSFTLSTGDRVAVVGLNGAGKTTLLRVVAGDEQPERGTVRRGRDVRIGVLGQRPDLPAGTVRAAVGEGWEAAAVLDRLGMGPLAEADTATLSGGQAKRVALARTLVAEVDLLILDEPTNHLDIDAIAWLEERLAAFRGGLLLVTHDRHVLDRVCSRVLELDRGRGHLHEGGYAGYLTGRAAREERAAAAEATRRILARRELAWLQRGAPARSRKPKARLDAAREIVGGRAEAPTRRDGLDLSAAARAEGPAKGTVGWGEAGVAKRYPGTLRLGDRVVEAHGVDVGWGDGPALLEDVELVLDNRERLGIVGPNGVGKSTLLDVLAGRRAPLRGAVVIGPTVRLAVYDQTEAVLDPGQRVRDAVAGAKGEPDWVDLALMEQFWFDGDAQWAPVGLLSGGERRRLQLLLTLAQRPNVVFLDEPTNDLDLDTLRALEDWLEDWPGALVAVSHDRAFLERTVTDVVVLDGSGRVVRRPGGYAAWEDERRSARVRGRATVAVPAGGDLPDVPAEVTTSGRGAPGAVGPKRRSPSTLRHLLRQAERELAVLERRRGELTDALAAVGADHEALARVGAELAEVATALGRAEEEWLALAAEAEEAGLVG